MDSYMNVHTVIQVCLAALLLTVAFTLMRSLLRRDKNITSALNIDDLFTDETGKTSKIAVVYIGSFVFTTWCVAYLFLTGKGDAGLLGTYGSLWVAPVVMKIVFNKSAP